MTSSKSELESFPRPSSKSMNALDIIELTLALIILLFVICCFYPILVMSDRQRPIIKQEYGLISTQEIALYVTTFYCMFVLVSKFKKLPFFVDSWQFPLVSITVLLVFFGTCDVWNAVRYQNRQAENKNEFGDVRRSNNRSDALCAFYLFDLLGMIALFIIVIFNLQPVHSPQEKRNINVNEVESSISESAHDNNETKSTPPASIPTSTMV